MSTIIVGCDENMVCVQTYREFIITIKELQFSKILTRKQKILTNVWSPSWIDFQKTNVMTFGHIGQKMIILVYIFKEKNVWMSIRQCLIYVAWCRQYPFDIIDNNFLFFDYCHCRRWSLDGSTGYIRATCLAHSYDEPYEPYTSDLLDVSRFILVSKNKTKNG